MKTELEIINIIDNGHRSANLYLFIYKDKTNLIDAGDLDLKKLTDLTINKSLEINNIFLTHGHFDHLAGIEKILELFPNVTIHIHEKEKIFLEDSKYNLSKHFNVDFNLNGEYLKNIKTYKDGDIIDGMKIIHTPGHTAGSSCIYIEDCNTCFTGDTLFSDTYGRTDLITGNIQEMKESLQKLFLLPPETVIYPGHAESEVLKNIKIFI